MDTSVPSIFETSKATLDEKGPNHSGYLRWSGRDSTHFQRNPQPRIPIKNRWEAEVAQQNAVQDVAGDPTGTNMDQDLVGFLGCTSKSWGSTREHYPKSETICRFQSSKSDKDPERQWYYWDGLRPAIYDGCSHALFKSKRLHFVVDRRGKLLQTL